MERCGWRVYDSKEPAEINPDRAMLGPFILVIPAGYDQNRISRRNQINLKICIRWDGTPKVGIQDQE